MDLGLSGQVALVTSASRGLGFASAKALAGEGASLLICAREPQRLEAATAELQSGAVSGVRIEQVALDASAQDAAARLVGIARERFGRLDVLVTNADGPTAGSFGKVGDADWERAFQLTELPRRTRRGFSLRRQAGFAWLQPVRVRRSHATRVRTTGAAWAAPRPRPLSPVRVGRGTPGASSRSGSRGARAPQTASPPVARIPRLQAWGVSN